MRAAHHPAKTGSSARRRSQFATLPDNRAALKARRFPDLARALARIPQAHAGRDVAEVRTFLCQAWAMAEATLPPLKRRRRAPAES